MRILHGLAVTGTAGVHTTRNDDSKKGMVTMGLAILRRPGDNAHNTCSCTRAMHVYGGMQEQRGAPAHPAGRRPPAHRAAAAAAVAWNRRGAFNECARQ